MHADHFKHCKLTCMDELPFALLLDERRLDRRFLLQGIAVAQTYLFANAQFWPHGGVQLALLSLYRHIFVRYVAVRPVWPPFAVSVLLERWTNLFPSSDASSVLGRKFGKPLACSVCQRQWCWTRARVDRQSCSETSWASKSSWRTYSSRFVWPCERKIFLPWTIAYFHFVTSHRETLMFCGSEGTFILCGNSSDYCLSDLSCHWLSSWNALQFAQSLSFGVPAPSNSYIDVSLCPCCSYSRWWSTGAQQGARIHVFWNESPVSLVGDASSRHPHALKWLHRYHQHETVSSMIHRPPVAHCPSYLQRML